jgi:enediyne biosynthesis protein E2
MSISLFTPLRLLAGPRLSSVTSDVLGFTDPGSPDRLALDLIPQAVVVGFESALEARTTGELVSRLELMDPEMRGFGYEGATMAYTIVDATLGGRRTQTLLEGAGRPHLFLAYIGIGFAMSKLPRRLWKKVLPDLVMPPYHPTLSWLAVDGYGFDLAYFNAEKYVRRGHRPKPWPWLGHEGYFMRAVDQGVGRALWFIHGADVQATTAAIRRFARDRQADLWSGVGLAATFAGPGDRLRYELIRDCAGTAWPDVAVGAAMACKARHAAELVPAHTDLAARVLLGVSAQEAAAITDAAAAEHDRDGLPAYEIWRTQLARRLTGVDGHAWAAPGSRSM